MEKQRVNGKKNQNHKPKSLALSIAAALFGVQSDRNRQHDFSQKSPWPFIIAGISGILLFIALVAAITLVVTATHGR